MKNNYSPKKVFLTAAIAIGTLASMHAQVLPLSNSSATVHAKTAGSTTPSVVNDFHQCPSSRLTHEYQQQNGLQYLSDLSYLQRQNTSTEVDPNRVVRTVPVVFHIVYDGNAATNVSDAVIMELLERLNEDFRKANSAIASIRPAFSALATDAQIEFCLATKNPQGQATTGINRRLTTVSYFDPDISNTGINYATGGVGGPNAMKGATYGIASWDRTKYVNIWICDITNGANSGTAGYAYLGGTSQAQLPPADWDGIVLDYNIGVEAGQSRAISHEMGHYFGLDHTWGDANGTCGTGDDGFADTPPVKGPYANYYFNCGPSSTYQSCTNGTLWMHENMMDYSDCYCMFTTQQANFMNQVLSTGRNSLNTSVTTNCTAPTPQVPVAAFNGCSANVTQGSTVTFSDVSTGVPTSWAWSISPGTGWSYANGTSATSQNPQVTFTATGSYTVTLTATNNQGSDAQVSNNCITVVTQTCNALGTALTMGFEAAESLTGWAVENTNGDVDGGGDDITWFPVSATDLSTAIGSTVTAHGGQNMAIYIYNQDGTTAANDWLYTPCLSLQTGTTYTISFWYRVANAQYPEKVRVKLGNAQLGTSMTQMIVDLGSKTNTTWVQQTSTFTVAAAGNYYVGFQCYSNADEYFVLLDDINISKQSGGVNAPVANFTGCGNYVTGTPVTLTNASTNSPTSNAWSITPGSGWSYTGGTSASSTNPQVTFTTPGTYTVSLTATNAGGNNTKTTQSCLVITANNAGIDNVELAAGVSLFPNPSTGLTTLSVDNASQYTDLRVNVYNAVGQLIYETPLTVDQISLDLSSYSKGIYFIEVRSNEAVTTKRLVLSK